MRIASRFNRLFFIVVVTMGLTTSCSQQTKTENPTGYYITGSVDARYNADSIYLYEINNTGKEVKLASAPVINGGFVLQGKTDHIQSVQIGNASEQIDIITKIILENDRIIVNFLSDEVNVSGGRINEMVFGYFNEREYRSILDKKKALDRSFEESENNSQSNDGELDQINNEYDQLMDRAFEIEDAHFSHIVNGGEHYPTVAKLLALTSSQDIDEFTPARRMALLDEYEKELGPHPDIKLYREFMALQTTQQGMKNTVAKGSSYKAVSGLDAQGNEIFLSDYVNSNKLTLLEFWASWCAPCRAEIPHLKAAYAKYKKQGLEIYSFSIDDKKKQWLEALAEDHTSWIQARADGPVGQEIIKSYGVDGIPASFLINKSGTIVATNEELRGEALDQTIAKFINE